MEGFSFGAFGSDSSSKMADLVSSVTGIVEGIFTTHNNKECSIPAGDKITECIKKYGGGKAAPKILTTQTRTVLKKFAEDSKAFEDVEFDIKHATGEELIIRVLNQIVNESDMVYKTWNRNSSSNRRLIISDAINLARMPMLVNCCVDEEDTAEVEEKVAAAVAAEDDIQSGSEEETDEESGSGEEEEVADEKEEEVNAPKTPVSPPKEVEAPPSPVKMPSRSPSPSPKKEKKKKDKKDKKEKRRKSKE